MNSRTVWLALLSLLLSLGSPLLAQESQADMEAMMQEYMEKYATPAEHHQHLEMLAGKWTTLTRFWPAPGAPPMESTGAGEHQMVLGGRYLQTSYRGEFMGAPFEGRGTAAYDRYQKKYVETWIDTMGTMILVSEGYCDGSGKVRIEVADYDDPMTGKRSKMRSVYRVVDSDHYTLELYGASPKGEEFKMMELEHTRQP